MIDAVCDHDDLAPHPGYIDDLVVAKNVDLLFVGDESGVPVIDVVLAFVVFCVGAVRCRGVTVPYQFRERELVSRFKLL